MATADIIDSFESEPAAFIKNYEEVEDKIESVMIRDIKHLHNDMLLLI